MNAHDPVSSVMTHAVVFVDPDTPLLDAVEVLAQESVGAAVVQGWEGPVGIVSERDVVRALAGGRAIEELTARDVMTPSPLWVDVDDTVSWAAFVMLKAGIRHLAVITDGELVGIVSMRDLVETLLESQPAQMWA